MLELFVVLIVIVLAIFAVIAYLATVVAQQPTNIEVPKDWEPVVLTNGASGPQVTVRRTTTSEIPAIHHASIKPFKKIKSLAKNPRDGRPLSVNAKHDRRRKLCCK